MSKHCILVVDDHPIVRQGLKLLVDSEPDLQIVGEAGSAEECMEAIARLTPDLVTVDISLEGISGIELIKRIKIRYATLPVLVLSMHDELVYAERAIRAGANGYVMKHEAPQTVVDVMRRVLAGELYMSERIKAKLVRRVVQRSPDARSPIELLSDRELEVLQLIGQGMGTGQIAKKLHLSVKTIETHRAHLKHKLSLSHANELVLFANRWLEEQQQGSAS